MYGEHNPKGIRDRPCADESGDLWSCEKAQEKGGKNGGGVFTFFEAKLTMNFINVVKRCLTAPDVKCVNLLTLQP